MNEKKFECPELIVIQFANEDIIVTSGEYDPMGDDGLIDFDQKLLKN